MEKRLKIDDLTESEFNNVFKPKYLDERSLSNESIDAIKDLFGIGKEETARIGCDDYHAHGFKCIHYHHPASGIVERLINEIIKYRAVRDNLVKKVQEGYL